jgi:hypothetical protein
MAKQQRQASIMGASFYPGAMNWITKMKPGQPLRLEREPNNPADVNAIAVYIFDQKLGHLPRGFAEELAPLADAGGVITAWKSQDPKFAGSGVIVVEWDPEG